MLRVQSALLSKSYCTVRISGPPPSLDRPAARYLQNTYSFRANVLFALPTFNTSWGSATGRSRPEQGLHNSYIRWSLLAIPIAKPPYKHSIAATRPWTEVERLCGAGLLQNYARQIQLGYTCSARTKNGLHASPLLQAYLENKPSCQARPKLSRHCSLQWEGTLLSSHTT